MSDEKELVNEPDTQAPAAEAAQPDIREDMKAAAEALAAVAESAPEPKAKPARSYVGVEISAADAEKHLQRPDDLTDGPVSALRIEGVCDIPWPAGVSWIDAVKNYLGR